MKNVVIVAGGTGALGQAVSRRFLQDGAAVLALYRDQAQFDALSSSVTDSAQLLEGHRIDVTDLAAMRSLVDDAVRRFGSVEALVNTVGGYSGGLRVWQLDRQSLEHMLALNLFALHSLCSAVVPHMLKAGRGAIVNVSSKAALVPPAGASAYAATKAAALAMMQSLAAELRGTGVRANSVVPNIIDTKANRRAMPTADVTQWTDPADIAQTIRFLCSDDARAIQGAAIPV